MEFFELIQKRQSCRNFDPTKLIQKEKVERCLEAARLTPSACNSQPWHFTVYLKKDAESDVFFDELTANCGVEINKFVARSTGLIILSDMPYNATAAIGSFIKSQDFRTNDIGGASAYLTLATENEGIASCILGWFNEKKLKKITGIKGKIRLVVAIGYAKENDQQRTKKRKELDDITTWL